ncbi:zinc finger protein, putative [Babesia caballi]|uniref:Zinc finger protein, putative n=1 Tax=Babesia caballi TaxID=5871 RepID=A0AAV4M377_BABCB|nr:zinc finger protein, putative [Babesia caballi]
MNGYHNFCTGFPSIVAAAAHWEMLHGSSHKPAAKRGRRESNSEEADSRPPHHQVPLSEGAKRRDALDLRAAIENDAADCEKKGLSSWKTAHAGASYRPARRLCAICGFHGVYKCVECASKRISQLRTYVCGPRCLEIHKDQNCGRPLNLTHW